MHHHKCDWSHFFHGHRGGALPVFTGHPYRQVGEGRFWNIMRKVFYPLSRVGRTVGKELFDTGRAWVRDVAVEGQDAKSALKKRALEAAQNLANKGFEH